METGTSPAVSGQATAYTHFLYLFRLILLMHIMDRQVNDIF